MKFTSRLTRSAGFLSRCLLLLGLLILAWLSAWPLMSPGVVPATAPASSFSAMRAMADLNVVAREPHGAGSDAQQRVRDYIVAQITSVGLTPKVQKSGQIENIVVRHAGTSSTGDVIISGHYDSHPLAPGAGDDGISVVAMLETIRVLRATAPLRNDLVFVFTDGEELGWLGAQAYIREHPATDKSRIALVFDARPGNGPMTLKETSAGDDWLAGQIASARPRLVAGSWLNAEERHDSDTDFTSAFAPAGFMGVEIENEARGTAYHSTADTVRATSPGIVQAHGESMLALARQFGAADLSQARRGEDTTFFSVPILGILVYPPWVTPATAVLAFAALVALAFVTWRRGRLSVQRTLFGGLVFLLALIAVTALSGVLWAQLLSTQPVTREATLGYLDFPGSDAWTIGIMTVALIVCLGVLYTLARPLGPINLAIGGLLVYLLLLLVTFLGLGLENPLTAPYFVWPFLGGVAGLAALVFTRRFEWTAGLLWLAAIPIFVLVTPRLLPAALRPQESAWIPVLICCLALATLFPQFVFLIGRAPAPTMPSRDERAPGVSLPVATTD